VSVHTQIGRREVSSGVGILAETITALLAPIRPLNLGRQPALLVSSSRLPISLLESAVSNPGPWAHLALEGGGPYPTATVEPSWTSSNGRLPAETAAWLRAAAVRQVVFLRELPFVPGNLLLDLSRSGIRRVNLLGIHGWQSRSVHQALIDKLLQRVSREVAHRLSSRWLSGALAEDDFARDIDRDNERSRGRALRRGQQRVAHCIGTLGPGGAERQLYNLCSSMGDQGYDVTVFTVNPLVPPHDHYRRGLEQHGVKVRHAGEQFREAFASVYYGDVRLKRHLLQSTPPQVRHEVLDLVGELLILRPHVLHCWLDATNIVGAIAGYLAGIDRIVISTRNVNPTHFPRFCMPWFRPWYRILANSARVRFIANSRAGARDYARWLGIEMDRFRVIQNGLSFDDIRPAGATATGAFRQSLGIPQGAPLVAGIFRLDPEKRPMDFLKVIARAREQLPELHAVIAGIGILEAQVRKSLDQLGLTNHVHLLGRRYDVPVMVSASDVVLLTSSEEGCPNVLLESQWLARPVVGTTSGGTPEAVEDGVTGFLHTVGDCAGMARSVVQLLTNRALWEKVSSQGPRFVQARFSCEQMVAESLAMYEEGTAGRVWPRWLPEMGNSSLADRVSVPDVSTGV
jgi:glycosyltransferase involved in cell wall biosynthesis